MTDALPPPPPPVGFVYDGSSDAIVKLEHLIGRKRMRMAEIVETRTQFNWRTQMKETASIPRPDPLTLEILCDSDLSGGLSVQHWVYVPIGARIDHHPDKNVMLTLDLGEPVHTLAWDQDNVPVGTTEIEDGGF